MPRKKPIHELRCRRLVLVDRLDNPRAILEAGQGGVSFALVGNSAVRISIAVDEDGSANVSIHRTDGVVAVALGISSDLRAGISIHDRKGRLAGVFSSLPGGQGELKLFKNGQLLREL